MALDQDDLQKITSILQPDGEQIDPAFVQKLMEENQMLKDSMTRAQVENVNAMTRKAVQDTIKSETEAALNVEKVKEVRANIQQKAAITSKTLEAAQQTEVETAILKKTGGKESVATPTV